MVFCTALLALAPGCDRCEKKAGSAPGDPAETAPAPRPRVVVVGFDGVDPDLVRQWMASGDLPHLKALAAEGTFSPLRSTTPPQSPVAWATFATGHHPGAHGIFDFIAPGRGHYLPRVATVRIERPAVEGGRVVRDLSGENLRDGPSFWRLAGEAGVPGSVLFVPYSFPPDGTGGMRVISGLGTPDVRGTNSTFQYFAEKAFPGGADPGPTSGGSFVRVTGGGAAVAGPPLTRDGKTEAVSLPVRFEADDDGALKVDLGGHSHAVARGSWSPTLSLSFPLTAERSYRAVTRGYAVAGREPEPLAFYLAPLSADPRDPPFALSTPGPFAAELAGALGGPFKTVGWIHETSGLSTEALDEAGFLADMLDTMAARETMLLHVLNEGHDRLTVAAFTATDRVAHMFYRLLDAEHPRHDPRLVSEYGDAVRRIYRRMDEIVGRVRAALPADAVLILVSDHGFHSFRRGMNVNRWLVDQGYMTLKPGVTEGREFFRDVDWSKTRAYALGTGQVWLNRVGREPSGIVGDEEAGPLAEEIAAALQNLRDGETPAVARVHQREAVYQGAHVGDAPELTVSFASGYRTGWGSVLGGAPAALFEDNDRKWSGDHAASDPADTHGFLMSNRALDAKDPGIEDVAPTVLSLYGVPHTLPGTAWLSR